MDDHGFERTYAATYEAVLRYCLRRASREDALDAAGETFAVAWRRREDIPADRPLPWLYGVARRVLANQRRSAHRLVRTMARARTAEPPPTDDAVTQIVRHEEMRQVIDGIDNLRPDDQEIIRLAAWEELDRVDLAAALGCSLNSASKRLNRALDHLAHELGVVTRPRGRFFRKEVAS